MEHVKQVSDVLETSIQKEEPKPQPLPTTNVKLDYYQTESDVVTTFFLKNQKPEDVNVKFSEQSFKIEAKSPDDSKYEREVHLAKRINCDLSSFNVLSTKIEIRLQKYEGGMWPALEGLKEKSESRPVYPTSSKKTANWDKLAKEVEKDEMENPDSDNVFAKIYESADENAQKAMVKSMQESCGTQLIMNWDEVKGKRLDVTPPDGMEFRRYD